MSKIHMLRNPLSSLLHTEKKTELRRAIPNIRTTMLSEDYLENFMRVYSKYKIGDKIWIKEPARVVSVDLIDLVMEYTINDENPITIPIPERFYSFDTPNEPISAKWITECRGVPAGCIEEMSRTWLEVTDIRIESLQDITTGEIIREGFKGIDSSKALSWWKDHWDSFESPQFFWEKNPKVFVYQLKKITKGK